MFQQIATFLIKVVSTLILILNNLMNSNQVVGFKQHIQKIIKFIYLKLKIITLSVKQWLQKDKNIQPQNFDSDEESLISKNVSQFSITTIDTEKMQQQQIKEEVTQSCPDQISIQIDKLHQRFQPNQYKIIKNDIQNTNNNCIDPKGLSQDFIFDTSSNNNDSELLTQAISQQSDSLDFQSYMIDYERNSIDILNKKLYLPSFKQRKVEDEYLQKFIRGQKDVQQYQVEYNLDGSQEDLLNNQIYHFVPIRGDGNCMFTSIGFQYLQYNIIDEERFKRLIELIDQTEFKQKFQNEQIETKEEQTILRDEFKSLLKHFTIIKDQQQLLYDISQSINNQDGPLYGLMVIFLRNYFRKILQDFYDSDELNWFIQDPEQINELITWEFMYDEADIALKLFAQQEKILIKCFKKMNVEDKKVDISDYHDENQKEFPYKIGLAFQPGHYNAILVKN